MTTVPQRSRPTARQKLEQSDLSTAASLQMQGLRDLELADLRVYLKDAMTIETADMITDARINRTIDGASTVTVDIVDDDRTFLRSGRLSQDSDIRIDGLWFRLASFDKTGKHISCTFEDRPIAILRSYERKMGPIPRTQITRAEFILKMIKEVKEFSIPWEIPALHSVQPIARDKQLKVYQGATGPGTGGGIPKNSGYSTNEYRHNKGGTDPLTVKTQGMSNTQIRNANIILDTGVSNGARRKVLVAAIMCVIQESSITNLRGDQSPDGKHFGCFQQDPRYWPASRDIARDAAAFFAAADGIDRDHPDIAYYDLVERVQASGLPLLYAQWRYEAERIVKAYGLTGADNTVGQTPGNAWNNSGGKEYFFYRGVPPQGNTQWGGENSWTCIQRLAREVKWRAFFIAGRFYYTTEDWLFNSQPAATVREFDAGIDDIQIQYDRQRKYAQVTIPCQMHRWAAPPGSVIQIEDCGPIDGRWLVTSADRSFFDPQGTVTLLKPELVLKEPSKSNLKLTQDFTANQTGSGSDWTGIPTGGDAAKGATKIIQYFNQGKYRDDNGLQMAQWRKVAKGKKLTDKCGKTHFLNTAVGSAIVYLIEQGYWIGTYAICEDHSCNGGQHPDAQAIDISSIGNSILGWGVIGDGKSTTTQLIKEVMKILQPTAWDLICNGNAKQDASIQALQMDNNKPRGGWWVDDHLNHIHYGVAPSKTGIKH